MQQEQSKERQLVSRIHRLEGQVRSLERVLGSDDYNQALIQFEAVIAAAKAALNNYAEIIVADETIPLDERRQILSRLIKD